MIQAIWQKIRRTGTACQILFYSGYFIKIQATEIQPIYQWFQPISIFN